MRDWEMAEHFAERDGVRMTSGQHIQAPESMIDRARRIVAEDWRNPQHDEVMWAEALLAEHEDCERLDAAAVGAMERAEEAERRADEERGRALEAIRQATVRAEQAERERDRLFAILAASAPQGEAEPWERYAMDAEGHGPQGEAEPPLMWERNKRPRGEHR